jgi:fatty-acid desaturase
MVLFFSITLLVSIVGLTTLLVVKRWELDTGNMVLAGVRPKVGRMSVRILLWVERVLPGLVVSSTKRAAQGAESRLHRVFAHGLLAAEHGLEHVLRSLRGMTEQPRARGEASEFLREVAAHKRKLLSRKVRSIPKE